MDCCGPRRLIWATQYGAGARRPSGPGRACGGHLPRGRGGLGPDGGPRPGQGRELAAAGRAYLAAFAASAGATMGDGAGNGAPPLAWPALDGATDATPRMLLDAPARRLEYADDACARWDELGYIFY